MEKELDRWNEMKKDLESVDKNVLFNQGEIWWCSLGLNVRQESCGKGENFRRPVLVLKKLSATAFIGIPLSSQIKKGSWFVNYKQNNQESTALLYQIKMFDINRMQRRIGEMDSNDFREIKKRLKELLNL